MKRFQVNKQQYNRAIHKKKYELSREINYNLLRRLVFVRLKDARDKLQDVHDSDFYSYEHIKLFLILGSVATRQETSGS